ncbi:hypothetical protein, partial [Tannerella forsythia]|uniref:hypothetical protein n=1 Tax=Tannerella forsythia TaxID=28112 RepID=UPI0028E28743
MKTIKVLLGFLPGVSLGMWLRAMWFCVSLAICNPTDNCSLWVVFGLVVNLLVSGLLVVRDREKWRR